MSDPDNKPKKLPDTDASTFKVDDFRRDTTSDTEDDDDDPFEKAAADAIEEQNNSGTAKTGVGVLAPDANANGENEFLDIPRWDKVALVFDGEPKDDANGGERPKNGDGKALEDKPKPINGKPDPAAGEPEAPSLKPNPVSGKPETLTGEPDPLNGKPVPLNGKPDPIEAKTDPNEAEADGDKQNGAAGDGKAVGNKVRIELVDDKPAGDKPADGKPAPDAALAGLKEDANWQKLQTAVGRDVTELNRRLDIITSQLMPANQSVAKIVDMYLDASKKRSAETVTLDGKPADVKPGDLKPGDAKSGDANSGVSKPGDSKAADGKPVDGRITDGRPADGKTETGAEAQRKSVEYLKLQLDGMKPLKEQDDALLVARASLLISSGSDENVKKGEESLISMVTKNPSMQSDERFHDLVLRSYVQMAAVRSARGLPPWNPERAAKAHPEFNSTASDTKPMPGDKSPMDYLQSANEKFWNSGIDEAVKDFNAARSTSNLQKQSFDQQRMEVFVSGLSKDIAIANAEVKGAPTEDLVAERSAQVDTEKKLAAKSTDADDMTQAININSAFAKIASGEPLRYNEGMDELRRHLIVHPDSIMQKGFRENLDKAMEARAQKSIAQAAVKDGEKPADMPGPSEGKSGYKDLNLARTDLTAAKDSPVQAYAADQITSGALLALGIGLSVAMARRSINRFRENRALNAEHGPKPIEGAAAKSESTQLRDTGGTLREVKIKGTLGATDRVVVQEPARKDDWKQYKNEGKPVDQSFDPAKKKYGELERLRVDSRDFYVDRDNKVFVERKGKLHETNEIRIVSSKQLEMEQRELGGLLNPKTAEAIYSLIYDAHGLGSPEYAEAAERMNVPAPKVVLRQGALSGENGYLLGQGTIVATSDIMIAMGSVKPERTMAMLHELVHLEQDTLMIRRLADQLGIGKTFSEDGKQQEALLKQYAEKVQSTLDPEFARKVLKTRDGRPLTTSEGQRADQLLESTNENQKIKTLERSLRLVDGFSSLLAAQPGRAKAPKSVADLCQLISDVPVFKTAFGEDPPAKVKELLEQWKGVPEGEKPANFNEDQARKVMVDYLTDRLVRSTESGMETARENRVGMRTQQALVNFGGNDQRSAADLCKFLLDHPASMKALMGDNPPAEVRALLEQWKGLSDGAKPEGWNEATAKDLLKSGFQAKSAELTKQRDLLYFGDPVEQEAWEVTRRSEIAARRPIDWDSRPGYASRSTLADNLSTNAVARQVASELNTTATKPEFVNADAAGKSKLLTESVRTALSSSLGGADGATLSEAFKNLDVKVGDYAKAELVLVDPTKSGKQNHFEIRIPSSKFNTESGRIEAVAALYADVHLLSELDTIMYDRPASSAIDVGSISRTQPQNSLEVITALHLKAPDAVAFGSTDVSAPVSKPADAPAKTADGAPPTAEKAEVSEFARQHPKLASPQYQEQVSAEIAKVTGKWNSALGQIDTAQRFEILRQRFETLKQEALRHEVGQRFFPQSEKASSQFLEQEKAYGVEADRTSKELKQELGQRVSSIESAFNAVLENQGLPPVKLSSTLNIDAADSVRASHYAGGKGVIELSSNLLLTGSPEEISRALRHQYVLYQQDRLVMSDVYDSDAGKSRYKGDHAARLEYRERTGTDSLLPQEGELRLTGRSIESAVYNALPEETRKRLMGSADLIADGEVLNPEKLAGKALTSAEYNNLESWQRKLLTGRPPEQAFLDSVKQSFDAAKKVAGDAPVLDAAQKTRAADLARSMVKYDGDSRKSERLADMTSTYRKLRVDISTEGGVEKLLVRITTPEDKLTAANKESNGNALKRTLFGEKPIPAEIDALLSDFQKATTRAGGLDPKVWNTQKAQQFKVLMEKAIDQRHVEIQTALTGSTTDALNNSLEMEAAVANKPTVESRYGRTAFDTKRPANPYQDAINATDFSDFNEQSNKRMDLASEFSWAIPNREALATIYDFAGKEGLVEIGAGKGYWANMLREMGVDVVAYDTNPLDVRSNEFHVGTAFSKVVEGDTSAASKHPDRTLLLCWPPPDDRMAADALKAYSEAGGKKLVFVGERPLPNQDGVVTGDRGFHQSLDKDWVLKETVELPHIPNRIGVTGDKLYVYEKRAATAAVSPGEGEHGNRVTFEANDAVIVKPLAGDRVLLYQPARLGRPTGMTKPDEKTLKAEYEKIEVTGFDGKPIEGVEHYQHKATGALIRIEAGMQFPAEDLMIANRKDVRAPNDFGPHREVARVPSTKSIDKAFARRAGNLTDAAFTTRVYENNVQISTPTATRAGDSAPKSTTYDGARDVRIFSPDGGKTEIPLFRNHLWFDIGSKNKASEGDVKAHITITNNNDKAVLDKLLIPLLSDAINGVPGSEAERLGLTDLIVGAKLKDPLDRDPRFSHFMFERESKVSGSDISGGSFTGPQGQNAKGYTFYGRNAGDIEKAAAIIDKFLATNAVVAPEVVLDKSTSTGNLGDLTKIGTTNRLSIVRETWDFAEVKGRWGASLDADLGDKIRAKYGTGGKLDQAGLDRLAKDAGVKAGLLTLDNDGKVALLGSPSDLHLPGRGSHGDAVYLDESVSNRTFGELTGRHAAYSIYRHANKDGPAESKDPAHYIAMEETNSRRAYLEIPPRGMSRDSAEFKDLQVMKRAILDGDLKTLETKFREISARPDRTAATKLLLTLEQELVSLGITARSKSGEKTAEGQPTDELLIKVNSYQRRDLIISSHKPVVALDSGNTPGVMESVSVAETMAMVRGTLSKNVRYAEYDKFALKAIPPASDTGEYKGSLTGKGVESISDTPGTIPVIRTDATAAVADKVLSATLEKPAVSFSDKAPENLHKDLKLLNDILAVRKNLSREPYKYDAQQLEHLTKLIKGGYLEYFSPENGTKIVNNLRQVVDHGVRFNNDLKLNNTALETVSARLAPVEAAIKNFESMSGKAPNAEHAWRIAWLMHYSNQPQETAERLWTRSVEVARSNLGQQISLAEVGDVADIQARNKEGLIGPEGTREAYKILLSSREIQRLNPDFSKDNALKVAEIISLDARTEKPLKIGIQDGVRTVQQAQDVSTELTAKDIYQVMRLRQDFKDVHKALPAAQRKIEFTSAETEAEVRVKVRSYIENAALEAIVEAKMPAELQSKWLALDEAFDHRVKGPEAAKKELIANLLTRQIENYAVKDYLENLKSADIEKLPVEDARKLLEMVTDSARTVAERLPAKSKDHEKFMDVWRDALGEFEAARKHFPSIRDERLNIATFEFIRQLTTQEVKDHHKTFVEPWLKHTMSESRLNELDPQSRAELVMRFIEAHDANRLKDRVDISEYTKLLRSLDPDFIRSLPQEKQERIELLSWQILDQSAKKAGLADAPEQIINSVDKIVDRVIGDHMSDATAKELLGYFNSKDLMTATGVFQARSSHLTIQGLNNQFESIAGHLRANGFTSPTFVRGRLAERIKVVCVGNSTEGEKLAYLMRKATGVQVDIHNVTDASQLPAGKFLILDKIPPGELGDALRARTANSSAYLPDSIQNFHNGINVFDLARAGLGGSDLADVRSKLVTDITLAKMKHNLGDNVSLRDTPIRLSPKDLARVRSAIEVDIAADIQLMRTQGLLHLSKIAVGTVGDTVKEAQSLGLFFEHGTSIVNFTDMLSEARSLYNDKLKGADPKKCLFVVDIDSQGSGRLATRLIREANGLTGSEFDKQFVTKAQAREMAKRGELKGMKLIGVDDCMYSGKTAANISDSLISIYKEAKPGTGPELVIGTMRAFDKGMTAAKEAIVTQIADLKLAGGSVPDIKIEVGNPDLIRDSSQTIKEHVASKNILRRLKEGLTEFFPKLFNRSEWAGSSVKSNFVYPHMVPNNNMMRMNEFYKHALGIAGAHSESRFDDPRFDKYSSSRIKGIDRFGYVNENIIRGGKPRNEAAVKELAARGITSVINMEKTLDAEVAQWFKNHNIEVIHMPVEPSNITAEKLEEVARKIQESIGPDKKCFIHCTHGRDRTGAVIAQYRVTREGWDKSNALEEMEQFGFTTRTKGLEYLPKLIPQRSAVERVADNARVGRGELYSVAKRDGADLRERYEKTKAELKVTLENPLRGEKAWSDFRAEVDKLKGNWQANRGESLPAKLENREMARQTYETLLAQEALVMAEKSGIGFDQAVTKVISGLDANPAGDAPLKRAYRDFHDWDKSAKMEFEEVRPQLDQRTTALQEAINKSLVAKGIPPVQIKWAQGLESANNLYMLGEGTIVVRYQDILKAGNFDKLVEHVYHETVHHAQDMEIVKAIAQQVTKEQVANGGASDPNNYRDLIRARYEAGQVLTPEKGAKLPDSTMVLEDAALDRALESMKGKPALTDDQIRRADVLSQSFKTNKVYRDRFTATEVDFHLVDSALRQIKVDKSNRTAISVIEALHNPEHGALRMQLFGASEIEKLPPRVREQIGIYDAALKAGKPASYDGLQARTVLEANLNGRLRDINLERRHLEESYLKPLHEIEAQLVEVEAIESRLKEAKTTKTEVLPDPGTVKPGTVPGVKPVEGAPPVVERPGSGERPGAEKPAGEKPAGENPGSEKPGGEKPKAETERPAETKLDTSRSVADHSGKDSAALVSESLTLSTLYNEGRKNSELGRTGLDKHFDRFRNNSRMMLDKLASTPEGKTEQLNQLLRKFSAQVDVLKDNPLIKGATVVADKSLSSGGKLVFMHGNVAIEPLFTDATSAHYRTATGEIKKAPLSELKVELRVSETALSEARVADASANSKLKAAEIVSTLFHQLHQVDQLRGRQERARMNGIDLASDKGDALARRQFLEREKTHADLAADFLQFNLNGNSLDGREPIHATPPVSYDIKKPISELLGERIVTSMGSDGRMKIFVLNKNKTVTELESERSEALIKDGFKKMVERCNEKIKEAEKAKNEELVEKYKAERERIVKDQRSYETDPAFRKAVHHDLARHASRARAGVGAAVTVMFLVTFTLDHMRKESHGSDLNLDIPISGN
ncbi:MAG: dual specificity protein phosphatase family protein [Candidatus Melainabacteria bacterium]|nr:dual specificity protein phosphatase family protein [Candidatus Melainabacteria bacterium]